MKVLLLNGPNLNTLGKREVEIYGSMTLGQIVSKVEEHAKASGAEIVAFQSNHEGALVDFLQENAPTADGIVVNPGALGHYGLSLRDALYDTRLPVVEVHISNIHAREAFRQHTVLTAIAKGMITGLGWRGYLYALDEVIATVQEGTRK